MSAIQWSNTCPNCFGKTYARNASKWVETFRDVFQDTFRLAFPCVCWYCQGTAQNVVSASQYLSLLEEQYDREHYGVSYETDQQIAERLYIPALDGLQETVEKLIPVPTPESRDELRVIYHQNIFSAILEDDPSAFARITRIPKYIRKFMRVCLIAGPVIGKPQIKLIFFFDVYTYEAERFVLKSRLTQTQVKLQLWADDAEGRRCILEEATRTFIYE